MPSCFPLLFTCLPASQSPLLYGLSTLHLEKLSTTVEQAGLHHSSTDHSLFVRSSSWRTAVFSVYVDYIVLSGDDTAAFNFHNEQTIGRFQVISGQPSWMSSLSALSTVDCTPCTSGWVHSSNSPGPAMEFLASFLIQNWLNCRLYCLVVWYVSGNGEWNS